MMTELWPSTESENFLRKIYMRTDCLHMSATDGFLLFSILLLLIVTLHITGFSFGAKTVLDLSMYNLQFNQNSQFSILKGGL